MKCSKFNTLKVLLSVKNTFLLVFLTLYISAYSQDDKIITGAEQLEKYLPMLKSKSVGVIANQTSILENQNNIHLVDILLKKDINVKVVFAPEHGFRGDKDAGEKINNIIDKKTNLPIISLYGKNKKPTKEQLYDVDILVFDIQDVGVRFYTYISTLHYVMEAASEMGIPLIILDRPNPNGHYTDGPILEKKYQSFVGMHPVPIVYGMTIGEYAQMINGERWLKRGVTCFLTIIELKNYTHDKPYNLPVMPSPNLPNAKAVNLYPSLCFFEGTNVSVGRGTNLQFQIYGAPTLKNVNFKFIPKSNKGSKYPKHNGKVCFGEDLTKTQKLSHISLEWLIKAYRQTIKKNVFFNSFFVKLTGTESLKTQIEQEMTEEQIKNSWKEKIEDFKEKRAPYLLYS